MRIHARRRQTADEGTEERLRRLLAVERRLESLVRTATEDAERRVAAARAARDARLAAARLAAADADAARARDEQAAHAAELAAIEASAEAAVSAISHLSDQRLDELARWAIGEAIRGEGEPS